MLDEATVRAELEQAIAGNLDLIEGLEDALHAADYKLAEELDGQIEEARDLLGFQRVRLKQLDSGILRDFIPHPQPEGELMQPPSIGRIVVYRSRTGDYDVPAIITATVDTLNEKGVELGHVPPLTSPTHVHLTCLTPGKPGLRREATDFKVESEHGRSENVAGTYQEWDIPLDPSVAERLRAGGEGDPEPGTWRWPERV